MSGCKADDVKSLGFKRSHEQQCKGLNNSAYLENLKNLRDTEAVASVEFGKDHAVLGKSYQALGDLIIN